jgi:hypothetical protein
MFLVLIVVFIVFVLITVVVVGLLGSDRQQEKESKVALPYRQKQYFFSRSELEFFKILNSKLDAHKYTVFTKVRLADFVEVLPEERENRAWFNKIKSKHVDYLVWDLVDEKIALAIELDGKSHNGSAATKSDTFKDEMYEAIGLRLERVRVGSSFAEEATRLVSAL